MTTAYFSLDEKSAVDYVKQIGLFPASNNVTCTEIGDGNINMIFRLSSDKKSVIIKQAYPYVRCVGEAWPLSQDRIRIEAEAMEIQARHTPDLVPEVMKYDSDLALIVMEDLSRLGVMRQGMIRMQKYPRFAEHIARFMADLCFYTSDLFLSGHEKKDLVSRFINPDLCKITEDLIFTDPYYDADRNEVNPSLRPYLEDTFWKKTHLRCEASKMKYKFLTEAQCLLHGDLHTGSLFADEKETKVFDTEFAFVGPMAFDIGLLLGNILINYISWSGKDEPADRVADYREYLLQTIIDIYHRFEDRFRDNWQKDAREIIASVSGVQDDFMRSLFGDMIGYVSAVMIRRMHGLARNIDVEEIADLDRRRDVQIETLELAEQLMMNRNELTQIEQMTQMAERFIAEK